jgi:FAD/FMN-containing dehydrogenase
MNSSGQVTSWGRVLSPSHTIHSLPSRFVPLPQAKGSLGLLPFGNGRSYGDSNLNPGGDLIAGRSLDRFIAFDPCTGILSCEGGVLLSDILDLVVPQGWFLPVTPGTRFVTVGGAIANDVHGKNHHVAGSFCNHVLQFELLRSDGSRRTCSLDERADWFCATVGGMGLTGLITWASLKLRRIASALVHSETIKFNNLDEFFELSADSERDHEYTVAWIDCAFTGPRLGRGLFNRANHACARMTPSDSLEAPHAPSRRRMPLTPPISLVNQWSLKSFNTVYFNKQRTRSVQATVHYEPFFYPLDALLEWNRLYGPKGFYQYQCALPPEHAAQTTATLLQTIAASGMGSFLAVLKQFGDVRSHGLLSFPTPGTTLALDFPNQGPKLMQLLSALDRLVLAAGGRLYPAKDGRMDAMMFQSGYPKLSEFTPFVDPQMQSSFWRRVKLHTP